jgi:tRNA (guanine37-N1)-methyltransferase
MKFDVVTIFPDFFAGPFDHGIVRRAREAGLVEVDVHDLRSWTHDRHHVVDDRPFGGGAGMVLKPEPLVAAVESLRQTRQGSARVVLTSPQGTLFDQSEAHRLATYEHLILLCGRYEGVDERVVESVVDEEISIGDVVLSGGELAACVVVDAIVRLLPGALGCDRSASEDSFACEGGLLDYPHYTRPAEFRGMRVPEVLLGGNHAEIARWRRRQSLERTLRRRPDLLEGASLGEDDQRILSEIRTDSPEGYSQHSNSSERS